MAVTIKDIARASGLSISTISNYINGHPLREKNEKAVKQAIRELGFKPNALARGLRKARTNMIGILMPSISNVFSAEIINNMESELLKSDYGIIICDCRYSAELQFQKTSFLLDRMVDGIVTMPIPGDARHIALAEEAGVPVVALDSLLDDVECDSIMIDNEDILFKATSALIALGHTRIGMICGSFSHYTARNRLGGYKAALEAHGIPFDNSLVTESDYNENGGYSAFLELWNRPNRPTAVLPSNYDLTNGTYRAINELGLSVPNDISLIGFDNTQLLSLIRPKPSLILQPTADIGRLAAELLLKRIKGENATPRKVFLTGQLIMNDSVKRMEVLP